MTLSSMLEYLGPSPGGAPDPSFLLWGAWQAAGGGLSVSAAVIHEGSPHSALDSSLFPYPVLAVAIVFREKINAWKICLFFYLCLIIFLTKILKEIKI